MREQKLLLFSFQSESCIFNKEMSKQSKITRIELNALAKEKKIPYYYDYTKRDLMVEFGINEPFMNVTPYVSRAELNLIARDRGISRYYDMSRYDLADKLGVELPRPRRYRKERQQHISITKRVKVGEGNSWRLRLLDSAGFLLAPLASLVKNLASAGEENFSVTSRYYELEKFNLLLRKGVFPYECLDDVRKLEATELPPIEAFYSTLNEKGISEEDYEHAKKV